MLKLILENGLGLFSMPCCAETCQNVFIQHGSDQPIKLFLGILGRAVMNAFERCAASAWLQHDV